MQLQETGSLSSGGKNSITEVEFTHLIDAETENEGEEANIEIHGPVTDHHQSTKTYNSVTEFTDLCNIDTDTSDTDTFIKATVTDPCNTDVGVTDEKVHLTDTENDEAMVTETCNRCDQVNDSNKTLVSLTDTCTTDAVVTDMHSADVQDADICSKDVFVTDMSYKDYDDISCSEDSNAVEVISYQVCCF